MGAVAGSRVGVADRETFDQVQVMVSGRATSPATHKPHRSRHPYALRGCVWCVLCGRRIQGHWVHGDQYYRCRFAAEYALANRVKHPLSVSLREDMIIGQVDSWLAREFAPHRLTSTLRDLAAAQRNETARAGGDEGITRKIAETEAGKRPTHSQGTGQR